MYQTVFLKSGCNWKACKLNYYDWRVFEWIWTNCYWKEYCHSIKNLFVKALLISLLSFCANIKISCSPRGNIVYIVLSFVKHKTQCYLPRKPLWGWVFKFQVKNIAHCLAYSKDSINVMIYISIARIFLYGKVSIKWSIKWH